MASSEVASRSMEEANINTLLPAEMLEHIFHLLPPPLLQDCTAGVPALARGEGVAGAVGLGQPSP